MPITDLVPWFQGGGAAAGVVSLGWNVVNAIRQNSFKNYENEFKVVEALINSTRELGNIYWTAAARDTANEQKLKAQIADLDSKISSLQSKGIIRDKQATLPLCLVELRKAITSDPFESVAWRPDPTKCAAIRQTADELLHQFLKRR